MNVAEVIQHLHDSEINGSVSWFFDGVGTGRIGRERDWRFQARADTLARRGAPSFERCWVSQLFQMH